MRLVSRSGGYQRKSPLISSGSGSTSGSTGSGSGSGNSRKANHGVTEKNIGSFTKLSSPESSPSNSLVNERRLLSMSRNIHNTSETPQSSKYLTTSHFYRKGKSNISVDDDYDEDLYGYNNVLDDSNDDDEEAFLPVNFNTTRQLPVETKWPGHTSPSSFTDLSEASVSKSALEDALNDFSEDSSASRAHY